ncbi:MAG TPA: GntR family transcriptional regulator [Isosphaeraceae bacterium]|nr:GntR family transcriptional regulator [Isosphaeraceae bacterium]
MSSSNSFAPSSLKQRAYEEIKQRILSGRLAPGGLLSERQLAAELKMSKTPVHAALERLEVDGLVTVAAQQGVVVREATPGDVTDFFEFRQAMEPFVVGRIAGRLSADQKTSLDRNLSANRQAVLAADMEANVQFDAEFHLLLCEFLGNREILRVMRQVQEKVHRVIYQISTRSPSRMDVSLAEHEAIAQAILSGDACSASERMVEHLRNGLRLLYQPED